MLRDEIAMIVCSPVLLWEQYSGIKTFIKRISRYRTDDFILSKKTAKEGANKWGNSSRLTQSFHFFMFEPIFSPVNAL
ncbi:hypothetical protein, partial [Escherichia coli]|uniref:hypothetical protein n=1 Tax=Escherichia coli TaxID=562 RepID=UPI001962919E